VGGSGRGRGRRSEVGLGSINGCAVALFLTLFMGVFGKSHLSFFSPLKILLHNTVFFFKIKCKITYILEKPTLLI
jgi:hypothetical protein